MSKCTKFESRKVAIHGDSGIMMEVCANCGGLPHEDLPVPDYLITLRAIQLFDGEYVGQSRTPLWEWAYRKAAQEISK